MGWKFWKKKREEAEEVDEEIDVGAVLQSIDQKFQSIETILLRLDRRYYRKKVDSEDEEEPQNPNDFSWMKNGNHLPRLE